MVQVTPWTWYPCAVQLDFQLVSRVYVEDAYGGHKKETLVTPYVPFALLLFVLLFTIIIYPRSISVRGLLCVCPSCISSHDDCIRLTGVVIVLERPHHREQQENDEQIATVTEAHSTV